MIIILQFYLVFYVLCLLHGLQRITSSPRFWMFFAGPAAIFAIDKVMLVIYIRVREKKPLKTSCNFICGKTFKRKVPAINHSARVIF